MAKHKRTTLVCGIVIAAMLAVTCLFAMGESLGIEVATAQMPYEQKLFSTDRVHTLDIVVAEDDWQSILDDAMSKTYIACNLVIDGDAVKNVAIRTKGNSSLSSLANAESDRYSFKIEFDHYEDGKTYYGLDKLALNNIIQDNTYMKDYLSYQMMGWFGAEAPLCSFVWITVNGEDWGLYLAVEGIEEAFAERNYGADYGQIYKPDGMDMGGGGGNRGENQGGFQRPDMMAEMTEEQRAELAAMFENGAFPFPQGDMPQMPMEAEATDTAEATAEAGAAAPQRADRGGMGGMPGGMMGSSDVALVYTDDEYDSYPNIFESAKFPITDADKDRLIASLKQLGEGENIEEVIDVDEVLRYFVVHNFVLNFDSYTGSMLHNYYLHEKDGVLSMIAWDYNLAFGTFGGRGGSGDSSTTAMVNFPINTPLSGGSMEDRPMIGQLLTNETYLDQYHTLFDAFIAEYFESGVFEAHFDAVAAMIAPYVERDPTKFCTYEAFETAVENLRAFCLLRAESIRGQLDGTIPATTEGQTADSSTFVQAGDVSMDAMGSNGFGGMGGGRQRRTETATEETADTPAAGGGAAEASDPPADLAAAPEGNAAMPFNMPENMPQGQPGGALAAGEASAPAQPDAQTEQAAPQQQRWPGMGGTSQPAQAENETTKYVYLGISALILVIGLVFAKAYKR